MTPRGMACEERRVNAVFGRNDGPTPVAGFECASLKSIQGLDCNELNRA